MLVGLDGQALKKLNMKKENSLATQQETRNKKLTPEQKHEIVQIFNLFDTDGSGTMGKIDWTNSS